MFMCSRNISTRGPASTQDEKWQMWSRVCHERMPRPPFLRGSESLMAWTDLRCSQMGGEKNIWVMRQDQMQQPV